MKFSKKYMKFGKAEKRDININAPQFCTIFSAALSCQAALRKII
jgi:hypothetical protein